MYYYFLSDSYAQCNREKEEEGMWASSGSWGSLGSNKRKVEDDDDEEFDKRLKTADIDQLFRLSKHYASLIKTTDTKKQYLELLDDIHKKISCEKNMLSFSNPLYTPSCDVKNSD